MQPNDALAWKPKLRHKESHVRKLIEELISKQTSMKKRQANLMLNKKLDLKLSLNLNVWPMNPILVELKQKLILLLKDLLGNRL